MGNISEKSRVRGEIGPQQMLYAKEGRESSAAKRVGTEVAPPKQWMDRGYDR